MVAVLTATLSKYPPGLKKDLAATREALDSVYAATSMNSTCYQLHAVMVHQGEASEGHYWAYVRLRSTAVAGSGETVVPATTSDVEMACPHRAEPGGLDPQGRGEAAGAASMGVDGAGSATPPHNEEVWLKFNDISVTEVKWEEVARESFGGQHNTSAYCLVYLSSELSLQWCEKGRREEEEGRTL